ncbi:MAG: DUF4194 domain-containing protein [Eubacterium sp.]|nr:DUF4194 domain-containing protein [Eubacterium sp.]
MFTEDYEKLGLTDRETFRRLVNWLLGHSFLVSHVYDFDENIRRSNPDYVFVERHFQLFADYFSYAGFQLTRDTGYGVMSLESEYEYNHVRFDKLTTLMIYALRLIYDEERERLSLSEDVFVTTGDLVHKLISLDALAKKPSNIQLRTSLRALAKFQILRKVEGSWEDADTRYLILPTILFIVSNERISNIHKLIDRTETDEAEMDGSETDGAEADGPEMDGT